MNIQLQNFELDRSIVPDSIYTGRRREITNLGVSFPTEIREELDRFVGEFISQSGFPESEPVFLRIDAYINPEGDYIQILDVNASFVDGWGNALNLTRAIGASTNNVLLEDFPTRFFLPEEQYRPEFELAIRELQRARNNPTSKQQYKEVKMLDSRVPTYIYGNPRREQEPNTYPYDALRMDNKRLLARFSEVWRSERVKIPTIYTPDSVSWESLPNSGVLKLTSKKDIEENPNIRRVQIGVKKNNKELKLLWDSGRVIVQDKVETMNSGDNNVQAILLATRKLVAGYTQLSPKGIINDDSIQGPLLLQS